ncbi:CinA family protein [Pseudomonas sp. UL073]|uniref:CinA family protein n=1 Tax=Zestomonas insulae TaxID=2809017 RepID=A0ABS2IFL6_9GAMM|nr:CinA family protein [Pseudomonas insulae]MBM7061887.1 CinA family protein [Pseudomonas insulae]
MQSIEEVVSFLKKYQLRLATAESCTAGLMAALVAGISGSGEVLDRGYIVYSPEAKQGCLGVREKTIELYGLTSEEVAREMALGALESSGADIVLANTGIAESDDDLDGVLCFACAMNIADHRGVVSETVHFSGERNEVRVAAAHHALLQLPYYYERLREG